MFPAHQHRSSGSNGAWAARMLMAFLALLLAAPAFAAAIGTAPVTDLAISKSADRAAAAPGEVVTWTVTVANVGTTEVPVDAIIVRDPDVVLTPRDTGSDAVLAPGGSLTYSGTTRAGADACPAITNTARVSLRGATDATALGGWTMDRLDGTANASGAMDAGGARPPETATSPESSKAVTSPKSSKRPKHPKVAKTPKRPAAPPAPTPPPVVDGNPANDTASATVVVACPPPAAPAPPAPVAPPSPPSKASVCPVPGLRIGIVAPRQVRAGRTIRVAVTVRNTSRSITATRVVARYTLPRGTVLARVPRGATLVRGRLVLRASALAPGASRTMRLVLRPTGGRVVTRRGHRADARERCRSTRTARTATRIQSSRPERRTPPVTG